MHHVKNFRQNLLVSGDEFIEFPNILYQLPKIYEIPNKVKMLVKFDGILRKLIRGFQQNFCKYLVNFLTKSFHVLVIITQYDTKFCKFYR